MADAESDLGQSYPLGYSLQLFGRPCIGNVLWEGGHQPAPSIIFFLLECPRQQEGKKKAEALAFCVFILLNIGD